jgi:predicted deacylase
MYIYDRRLSGPQNWRNDRRLITLRPTGIYEYSDFWKDLGEPDESIEESMKNIRSTLEQCDPFGMIRKLFRGEAISPCWMVWDKTLGGNAIEVFLFPGKGTTRAMVIGGVHGSELAGSEVVQRLIKRLFDDSTKGIQPNFTVAIIPVVFPDNAALALPAHKNPGDDNNTGRITEKPNCTLRLQANGREECVDPNRQFPTPGREMDIDKPNLVDALGTRIEKENIALLRAITRFNPSRIATVHAHKMPEKLVTDVDAPGIFADPHTVGPSPTAAEVKQAQDRTAADCELAKKMAAKFLSEYNTLTSKDGSDRIPGNWVKSKKPTICVYGSKASKQCGVSLGQWGPRAIPGMRDGITVITMEVRHYYPSTAPGKRVGGKTGETEVGAKNRLSELKAHTAALRDVFLEVP